MLQFSPTIAIFDCIFFKKFIISLRLNAVILHPQENMMQKEEIHTMVVISHCRTIRRKKKEKKGGKASTYINKGSICASKIHQVRTNEKRKRESSLSMNN